MGERFITAHAEERTERVGVERGREKGKRESEG